MCADCHPQARAHARRRDALHDHEPDRLRSFPAGHHPAVRPDGSPADEQHEGSGCGTGEVRAVSSAADGCRRTDFHRSVHQERPLPVPHMGAGCLRLFYPDVRCGTVLLGQQGLHLPADEDYVPRNWAGRHCLHWHSGCAVRFRACWHGDGQHFRHSSDRHSPDDCVLLRRADWLCLHGHRLGHG